MNGTRETDDTATDETATATSWILARRRAAGADQAARRSASSTSSSPLLLLGAAVVLVAFGAVWLSVRGQHPYRARPRPALLVMYGDPDRAGSPWSQCSAGAQRAVSAGARSGSSAPTERRW